VADETCVLPRRTVRRLQRIMTNCSFSEAGGIDARHGLASAQRGFCQRRCSLISRRMLLWAAPAAHFWRRF